MTRLANMEIAGFYAAPPEVTHLISEHITALHGGRILDPCAGEGTALVTLAEKLGMEPFGVELHEGRTKAAREAVGQLLVSRHGSDNEDLTTAHGTRILHDSYLSLVTSRGGYNLLYLNPPYDHDDEDGRLEYQWLVHTRPWLQPGGLLVWVVPQHMLRFRKATRYILSWYDQVQIYRFPDDSYDRFKQIVLFGVLRPKATAPDSEMVERVAQLAAGKEMLQPLTAVSEPTYTLPPLTVKHSAFKFRSQFVDPADALAEARQLGASSKDAWREHLDPNGANVPLRPLTPLKIGHMNSVIAAGHLNNQVLADDDERLLIKGRNYKVTRAEEYEEPLPDGRTRVTHLETESVVTDITTVDSSGQVTSYKGAELEQFLQKWIAHLTGIVAREYPPVYQFDLNGYGRLLNSLSKKRKIPGMNGKSGLLPAQKHAAAAILTRLETYSEAVAIGEMGTGKAQGLDNKVLTPTGWKRMGDIQVGDEVVNPEGGTSRVVGVYPQGKRPLFRVTFSDGSQTECCDEHLWQVNTPLRKWRDYLPMVLQLQEMRQDLFTTSGNARYFVPLVEPVAFLEQTLPLDPYLMGVLLGDGTLGHGNLSISSMDEEIIQGAQAALPDGLTLKPNDKITYRIVRKRKPDGSGWAIPKNLVTVSLRQLGLYGTGAATKFIPKIYQFASVSSRIALLQGLLDTDGTIGHRNGCITFTSVSEQLAEDFAALVQSLGGVAKTSTRRTRYKHNGVKRLGRMSHRVSVSLPNEIQPFRLSRKLERVVPRTKYQPSRAIVEVEYVGKKEAQCIALDSENQLYVTDDYIVTHNTTIGASVAAGRHARRTIVLCPPHLVDKWQREFKAVWPGVRTIHLQTISDVDQFFGDQPDDTPLVGVLKQTTARSASGWEHAYDYGGPASHNYGSKGYSDIERPWGNVISARKLLDLPVEERPFTEKQILALQQRGIRCPVCGETQFRSGRPLTVNELKTATWTCSNEQCRSPLYQFTRRRSDSQVRGSSKLYAQRERLIRSYTDKGQPVPFHELEKWHGSAVKDTFGYGKVPLAGYIKKRGKGKLDLLLVDEVHQYKGFDSDQGYAMHHLAQAAEKVVALTGTIYGGKASSLFYLLFRLAPEMGHAYVDSEATGQRRLRSRDWVSAYGILQRIETITLDEDGKQTANSRSNVRFKELPGGSPAMLPWLLNRSVFLSLGDMGFPLPDYTEIPVSVPMAPEQAVRYESLKEQLKEELKERLIRGDKSLLAGYLYALLFWPDSPRRAKVVECPRTGNVVASVPGLPDEFVGPKEDEIIELCLAEKAQGRRVLLLCQQTDTLDIQPEWQAMLEAAGLKATILRAAPNKREKWVEKQVKAGVDVIITHPRKVETGIDLLDFPTIVWMAIDYSVYTVLQASRRSWRIGQTEPVKVYFFAYEDTIQEDALRLVAAKVAAALRVNGDTVGDDSLAELDDLTSGDLVATLAKIITGDVQIEAHSLQQAFAEANASLRQANTIIGDYQMMEEEPEEAEAVVAGENGHLNGAGQRPALSGPTELGKPKGPLLAPDHLAVTNGHNGRSPRQTSLFTNGHSPIGNGHGQEKPNGAAVTSTHLNGKQAKHDESDEAHEPAGSDKPAPPPVPRPRLLLSQLSA
ncbi:MAG: hypothetical protein BroJett014_24360 [Planctomycetota bacterium]|nr:MAG: hypothetical protein BroJett014_24360 [Planctomycetota bacterium]